jgi:putative phosphoesterase
MKLIIASDIHGDIDCTNGLLTVFQKEKANKLVLLGDILYHGPRNDLPAGYNPKKVITALNEIADKIICVRGNCDAEVDQMVLSFPIMDDFRYIEADGLRIFATHGHHYNQDIPPRMSKGEILIHGHTHIPKCERFGDNYCMNPGSISIPKGGYKPSYMIYENRSFVIKDFDGGVIFSITL